MPWVLSNPRDQEEVTWPLIALWQKQSACRIKPALTWSFAIHGHPLFCLLIPELLLLVESIYQREVQVQAE